MSQFTLPFIEGDFEKAMAEKKVADSLYGETYWNPQLLYIQAISEIRRREDSLALNTLNDLMVKYPTSPLKDKAKTLVDVLGRRSAIESYLDTLQVARASDSLQVQANRPLVNANQDLAKDLKPLAPAANDSSKTLLNQPAKPVVTGPFKIDPTGQHYVVMVLNKIDPVFISEARSALNRYAKQKLSAQPVEVSKEVLDAERTFLVFKSFATADDALNNAITIKKDAAAEVSWLPANKYSFIIISEANLDLLKQNKDMDNYRALMNNTWPGRL